MLVDADQGFSVLLWESLVTGERSSIQDDELGDVFSVIDGGGGLRGGLFFNLYLLKVVQV